jgi:hypothetical protein
MTDGQDGHHPIVVDLEQRSTFSDQALKSLQIV